MDLGDYREHLAAPAFYYCVEDGRVVGVAFPRGTVLLVEEDPEWRERVRDSIRAWSYDARCAWSYAEALLRAREIEPRVVVVTLDRLEGGSVDFAIELHRLLPETALAVITGSRVSAASVRLRLGGLGEVFVKPLQLPELEQWLDEQLAPHDPEG